MKIKEYAFLFTLILALMLLNCSTPQSEQIDMDQLQKIIAEFQEAVQKSDADKVASFYANDAIMLPANEEIVKGKQAIGEHWKNTAQSNLKIKVVKTVELSGYGNIAYQINKTAVTYQTEGQEAKWNPSKNVHIWKKQADGGWKLHVDIWNNSIATAE